MRSPSETAAPPPALKAAGFTCAEAHSPAATAPLAAPSMVGFPRPSHSANIHDSAAAAVAVLVATKALVASALAASALPALKPNQPTQRSAAPVSTKGMLCGGMG